MNQAVKGSETKVTSPGRTDQNNGPESTDAAPETEALSSTDEFPAADLGVRRTAAAIGLPDDPTTLTEHARRWRPWRSYAVLHLWHHPIREDTR